MARYRYNYYVDDRLVSKQELIKIVGEEITFDNQRCGWFSVSVANYEKAKKYVNNLIYQCNRQRGRYYGVYCGYGIDSIRIERVVFNG